MKLVATTVGSKGPESQVHNKQRLEAAKQALIEAKAMGADVLILPGGFFTAHDSQSRRHIAASLINEVKELSIAVIFGVDEVNTESSQLGAKGRVRKKTTGWLPDPPMYGYAWSPAENVIHCWRQRSTNSTDQWLVDNKMCKEVRLLIMGNEALGVLVCGEIFNERIRNALRKRESRPKVIADIGHRGAGFRISKGMRKLGLASMCSLHVQGQNAKKRYYIPGKGYMSTNHSDKIIYGPPRIEMKRLEF